MRNPISAHATTIKSGFHPPWLPSEKHLHIYTFQNKNIKILIWGVSDDRAIKSQHPIPDTHRRSNAVHIYHWRIHPPSASQWSRCFSSQSKNLPLLMRKGAFCAGHLNSVGPVMIVRVIQCFFVPSDMSVSCVSGVSSPITAPEQELMKGHTVISFTASCLWLVL